MNAKRKKVEDFLLGVLDAVSQDPRNRELYTNTVFPSLSDKAFEELLKDMKARKRWLSLVAPNGQSKLSVKRNIAIAKKLGYDFFQQLWIEGKGKTPTYLTTPKYMVLDQYNRRAAQRQEKKISVPKNSTVIDQFSGQVTGASKGAAISLPQIHALAGTGFPKTAIEYAKYRGGDKNGMRVLNAMISKTGSANQGILEHYASGVESKRMLRTLYAGMMLDVPL